MKEATPSSPLLIEDRRLARVFGEASKRRLLLSLIDEAKPVSELARQLQWSIGHVHYHVTDLARRNLLKVEREIRRDGRPIKYYRAVASSFLVPLELLEATPGESLAAKLRSSLTDELLSSDEPAVLFYAEAGAPRASTFGVKGKAGKAAEFWHIVRLEDEAVKAFARELDELMHKYEALSGEGRPYLLHAAFAPRKQR
jgi:hypothetical protein